MIALNEFLGAFLNEETRIHQEQHLQEVALECTKFGHAVLSQPAEYIYNFGSEDERELVVCPGLEKISNNNGDGCVPETVAAPEKHSIVVET